MRKNSVIIIIIYFRAAVKWRPAVFLNFRLEGRKRLSLDGIAAVWYNVITKGSMNMTNIGMRIKELRCGRGVTQERFAAALGLTG